MPKAPVEPLLVYGWSSNPRALAVIRRAAVPVSLVTTLLGHWHLNASLRYLDELG